MRVFVNLSFSSPTAALLEVFMKLLWTWSGKFFGYLENDILRTQDGRHVGHLHDKEIYGPNGVYLGELMNESRLIRCSHKRNYRKHPSQPLPKVCAIAGYTAYCGYAMYSGYEDFSVPIFSPLFQRTPHRLGATQPVQPVPLE